MISEEFTIFGFFLTASMSVASLHIGLIRLIASTRNEDIDRERGGVLIVIQFALAIIFCSSIPMATIGIDPNVINEWH